MTKVYVLQAQGFGDDEYAFANIGVFSSMEKLQAELAILQEEWETELQLNVVTNVEEYTLDA